MPAILESPPLTPSSIADLSSISLQLVEEVARLPLRSEGFTVDDYLSLDGNYFTEFVDGCIQVLPMPDSLHQALTHVLIVLLDAWAATADPDARTIAAPFRVYLTDVLYREPDVALMLGRHAARRSRRRWVGADLVVEIISDSNRDHDLVTKRRDYAAAVIPEYWIIDPDARAVRVLALTAGGMDYTEYGPFGIGQTATSILLPGFAVDVADLFAAADRRV